MFRTEYGKIVSVLCGYLGFQALAEAEDIASETFMAAMETWPYKGAPENPTAWLYTVAKNKAMNHIRHQKIFREKVAPIVQQEVRTEFPELDLGPEAIQDGQLRMLFAICDPNNPMETQIALALRVLCGFGIDEIANAFRMPKATINKRLQRGRQKLRSQGEEVLLPKSLETRLPIVQQVLYLLFNEGYYSESEEEVVRKELCLEAMRLVQLLLQDKRTKGHTTASLMALFCFHASRLEARVSHQGTMVLYDDQEASLWNTELVERGFHYLQLASSTQIVSPYYLEASIAYWHTVKNNEREKWKSILALHNALMEVNPTPTGQLNRLYAVFKVHGAMAALEEVKGLQLPQDQYYHVLMAELYKEVDPVRSQNHLRHALEESRTEVEKKQIRAKMESF